MISFFIVTLVIGFITGILVMSAAWMISEKVNKIIKQKISTPY